jgi:hypothetical protein
MIRQDWTGVPYMDWALRTRTLNSGAEHHEPIPDLYNESEHVYSDLLVHGHDWDEILYIGWHTDHR